MADFLVRPLEDVIKEGIRSLKVEIDLVQNARPGPKFYASFSGIISVMDSA